MPVKTIENAVNESGDFIRKLESDDHTTAHLPFAKAREETPLDCKSSLPAWELGLAVQVLDGDFEKLHGSPSLSPAPAAQHEADARQAEQSRGAGLGDNVHRAVVNRALKDA